MSIKEHRILHYILAKATNTKSDWHAAKSLYKYKSIKTSAEYEKWKFECSERMKNKWKNLDYREYIVKAQKGKIPWNKGIKLSTKIRRAYSQAHLGVNQSEESKSKISQTLKDKANRYIWAINGNQKEVLSVSELIAKYKISRKSAYILVKDSERIIKKIQCINIYDNQQPSTNISEGSTTRG